MLQKNNKNDFVLLSTFLILQLYTLYFIKYLNQGLSIFEFSFLNIGNLINGILYLGIIVGLFIIIKQKNGLPDKKKIITFFIMSWVFILLAIISTNSKIFSSKLYVLNQPLDKLLSVSIFLIFLITLLQFLIYVWSICFGIIKPKFINNFLGASLMLALLFIGTIIYIDNSGYTSDRWSIKKNTKNIAVVLGAAVWSGNVPSPTLSSRVDKALTLMEEGFVGKIVLTGGKAPGELPESEVALAYAIAKGVDTSRVSIESYSSSTADQIRWIKNNLFGTDYLADIILISDSYHLPRVIEISKFFNLNLKVAESLHKLNFGDMIYNKMRESIALFIFWNFAL